MYAIRFPRPGNLLAHPLRARLPEDNITSFAKLAETARQVADFYASAGIAINPVSELAKLLRGAHAVFEEWQSGKGQSIRSMIAATHSIRVVDSIMMASSQPAAWELLRRIARNDVDLAGRSISQGKDALWEIELLLYLTQKGIDVTIGEPDLIAELNHIQLPIACKKIYSASRVEGSISKGVSQLAGVGQGGIVALNVDHLLPADTILAVSSIERAQEAMHHFLMNFLKSQEAKIRRFIQSGRCDGVLVSATAVADIEDTSPRINRHTQVVFWSPADWRTAGGQQRIAAFRQFVQGIDVTS